MSFVSFGSFVSIVRGRARRVPRCRIVIRLRMSRCVAADELAVFDELPVADVALQHAYGRADHKADVANRRMSSVPKKVFRARAHVGDPDCSLLPSFVGSAALSDVVAGRRCPPQARSDEIG